MKASGSMTSEKAKALKGIQMATLILDSLKLVELMVKASTLGEMERCSMGNGNKAGSKATVFGKAFRMTLILESGRTQRHMAMGCILGPMEIGTKGSGICV